MAPHMAHITRDKAITVNGQTWWVDSRKSGLIVHQLKAIINQVNAMLSYHSKVHVIRIDLHLYKYTDDNSLITVFNRRLFKWLKRKYEIKRIGFAWTRELEKAKQQHYHYALMIDGHKVRYPKEINSKIDSLWKSMDCPQPFFPDNCFYNIHRDDYSSIQDAIKRLSYLAKARGKGFKPDQTKNHGTSRIKPRSGLKW